MEKKKKHTIKSQIIIYKKTKKFLFSSFSKGKTPDFKLFKKSKFKTQSDVKIQVDSGYQGLQKIHKNGDIPKKKTKKIRLQKKIKNRIDLFLTVVFLWKMLFGF